jgi:hypothetical protein
MAYIGHNQKTDPPGLEMTVPDREHDPDPEEPLFLVEDPASTFIPPPHGAKKQIELRKAS